MNSNLPVYYSMLYYCTISIHFINLEAANFISAHTNLIIDYLNDPYCLDLFAVHYFLLDHSTMHSGNPFYKCVAEN